MIWAFFFCICEYSYAQGKDTAWLLQNTWAFENFSDTNVSWNLFRQSYIGVAPSPSGDFDIAFYDALYKNVLFNPGNCYGMDVTAMIIMQNGGYQGYCHPPFVYAPKPALNGPQDSMLHTLINITHGYQINNGFISFLLNVISTHNNRNGNYAFDMVHQYLMQGDQPICSISTNLSPADGDGGHVLVPYFEDTITLSPLTRRIFVYDPNRSIYAPSTDSTHIYYTLGVNFIKVLSDGTWSYPFKSHYLTDPPWTGNPGSGGNCIAIPLSVAGKKDRLPQSLFTSINQAVGTIFIFGNDVKVKQITDLKNHRHYFNKNGTDEEPRPDKRMNNVLPFIPLNGKMHPESGSASQVYFIRGNHPFQLAVLARGAYKVAMNFGGRYIEQKGIGDGTIHFFHSPSPVLTQNRKHSVLNKSPLQ
jgi:hypothetical protein